MASFRKGFKIFGEFSIKQGLGRIRSFSEDRKPGRWLPEDQWAVRQPESTCPDPCKPCKPTKKPQKSSKSWLSLCKDPDSEPAPIPCDIRHNNCPPPPPPPKEGAWFSLESLMPKKKPEKPPPLSACREERRRREIEGIEEVCEKSKNKPKIDIEIDEDKCSMPKQEPCPAPVVTMSCPLPKELDIMLWCGRPSKDTCRIAMRCQSDRLPYEEFKPQKRWKPPPFSLPCKADPIPIPSFNRGSIAYAEFKQVEVPRPLYTRYKSVELCDKDFLLCSIEVQCPDDYDTCCMPETPEICACLPTTCCPSDEPPCRRPCLPLCCKSRPPPCPDPEEPYLDKPVVCAAGCRPTKIRKAQDYAFRPKPTKLVERRVLRNPLCSCKCSESRTGKEEESDECRRCREDEEPPKVITGTLTDEPQVYERECCVNNPPSWMYVLCKPGCKDTPLLPKACDLPDEPDWCSETDGLNFYDDNNENIRPKPPPDPCKAEVKVEEKPVFSSPPVVPQQPFRTKSRVVLMPEEYNIKYSRVGEAPYVKKVDQSPIDEFIQAKTHASKTSPKSYPAMKENILYDLQRLCPRSPVDPTKINCPCFNPVPDPCGPRWSRCFSTYTPPKPVTLTPVQLQRLQKRTDCGDSSGKCKVRKLVPKPKDCEEKIQQISENSDKAGVVKSLKSQAKEVYASTVKCQTIKPKHNNLGAPNDNQVVLGLNDDPTCDYEQRNVVIKPKKRRANPVVSRDNQYLCKESPEIQTTGLTMPEMNYMSDEMCEMMEPEEIEGNFVTFSSPPVRDKDISKDFVSSIGSWINDLFSVPAKRPSTAPLPKTSRKQKLQEVDTEFLKSLNVLKEELKNKLKNETSIHLSTGDKFLDLNFDKLTEKNSNNNKKKSNWVSPLEQNFSVADSKVTQQEETPSVHKFPIKINDKENILVAVRPEDNAELNNWLYGKEKSKKERFEKCKHQEEQFFTSPADLSRNLLLNVNDQEKFTQLYKNAPFAIHESQPYNQRRAKHNARCYTTNANLVENAKTNSLITLTKKNKRSVFHLTNPLEEDECLISKKNSIKLKKKANFESNKDGLLFDRGRTTKAFHSSFESVKIETKSPSDELVKHLIRKTKVSARPPTFKKKAKASASLTNPKTRFMQSATNSLVSNVLAKKESDLLLNLKSGNRIMSDNKFPKSDRVIKELSSRQRDIRFEIKNVIAPKFTKSTFLNHTTDNSPPPIEKPIKRLSEDPWYRETKDHLERNKKGQDIKQILSKIDKRHESLRTKHELRDQDLDQNDCDIQNARFQRQHDLFRNNLRGQTVSSDSDDESMITARSAEFIILNTNTQSMAEKPKESPKYDLTDFSQRTEMAFPEERDFSPLCESLDNPKDEFMDVLCPAKKPPLPKYEKKSSHYKNKLVKTKSLQYLKKEDTRELINPLTEFCNTESHNPKEHYERQVPPTEIRPPKSLEPVLQNRSFSTNVLERFHKPEKFVPFGDSKALLACGVDNVKKEGEKKKKKKETIEKEDPREGCESDTPKKPGPNCDKSDFSP